VLVGWLGLDIRGDLVMGRQELREVVMGWVREWVVVLSLFERMGLITRGMLDTGFLTRIGRLIDFSPCIGTRLDLFPFFFFLFYFRVFKDIIDCFHGWS
jgi:hypothetical protein